MRFIRASLLGLGLAASLAPAQITVGVALEQDQFLAGETLIAAVCITNRSGETLHLGTNANWLTVIVEGRDGLPAEPLAEAPTRGEFTLGSSEVALRRLDLAPCFNLSRVGRYTITAIVRVPGWEDEFKSRPKGFDIINGYRFWERDFGFLAKDGTREVRKYTLQQATYLKQLRLYLRVTDARDTRNIRVESLGSLVSFGRPEAQVDAESRLHVLWQTGARTFNYCVADPDGEILVRQTHELLQARPKLALDELGKVTVAGGQRRVTSSDIPPPPPEEEPATTIPPVPPLNP